MNSSQAFCEDKFDLWPFSQKLEKYLMIEHDYVIGSLVVSLNAPFGSGKTTFLSMWAEDAKLRRSTEAGVPVVLLLNAWESDYSGDPLLAITSGLIRALEQHSLSDTATDSSGLRDAAKDVAWFSIGVANGLTSKWSGIDVLGAGKLAEEKKKARSTEVPDFLKIYEHRANSLQKLKEQLKLIFGSEKPKAIVMVDELDRCRPDYAINYLETVKHVFDIHGMVFVIGVDFEQLSSSARVLYGNQLNAHEYFRKFFQRSFSLPEVGKAGVQKLVAHYSTKFLHPEGKRACRMNLRAGRQYMADLALCFAMTARQIQELFRLIGHVAGDHPSQNELMPWGSSAMSAFLVSLKVARNQLYHEIGRSSYPLEDVGKLIIGLKLERPLWWFMAYALGVYDGRDSEFTEIESALNKLGLRQQSEATTIRQIIQSHSNAWEMYDGGNIHAIYRMIETADSFGSQ